MHDKLKVSDLNESVIVSMPIGMSVVYRNVYRDVLVKINEGKMRLNFILLSIGEFYAILKMDGLSHYRANVNYYTRQVEFKKENEEKITFIGENRKTHIKIISVMMAMNYISNDGYEIPKKKV